RRGEELPGGAGVTPHDRARTVPLERTQGGEHVRRGHRQVERELRRHVPVRDPPHTVGTEQSTHLRLPRPSAARLPLCTSMAPRSAGPAGPSTRGDQRLEYCGALRAFFRPAFLRSTTRASRVRKPAFFSAGRLCSASMAFSARAMPRRSAPAWPDTP